MLYPSIKRVCDVIAALSLGAIMAIPGLLVALAIRVRMGKPVLFRQVRPGKDKKPFTLLKFRTMTEQRGPDGRLLPDSVRLTRLGRFLRRTSLDELPQLWNVLRGEMSFVGPRPLLMRYLPYYTSRESLRFAVTPGITGWAQVNGRNCTPWDERLEFDAWYAENRSPALDLKILLKSVSGVFRASGVVVDAGSVLPDLDEERGEDAGRELPPHKRWPDDRRAA